MRSALATACMRLTALSFCAVLVRYWLAVCTDSFEQARDLVAGVAVGGELQAFELALRDRREFRAFAGPHPGHGVEQREAAGVDVEHALRRERDFGSEEDDQAALAALGMHGKGDDPTCRPTSGSIRLAQPSAANDADEAPEPGTSFHQQGTLETRAWLTIAGAVARRRSAWYRRRRPDSRNRSRARGAAARPKGRRRSRAKSLALMSTAIQRQRRTASGIVTV